MVYGPQDYYFFSCGCLRQSHDAAQADLLLTMWMRLALNLTEICLPLYPEYWDQMYVAAYLTGPQDSYMIGQQVCTVMCPLFTMLFESYF